MRFFPVVGALAAMTLMSGPAQAVLQVDVTGSPGAGVTTWTFSGSSVAGGSGSFSGNTSFDSSEQWLDLGDYTSFDLFDVPADGGSIAGSAQVLIGSDSRGISAIFVDSDAGAAADDFAIGVDGSTDFGFVADDVVSWTGVLTVTGIDLNDLDESALPTSIGTDIFNDTPGTLAVTLNISADSAVVPLPPALPLLLAGLASFGFVVRRRR